MPENPIESHAQGPAEVSRLFELLLFLILSFCAWLLFLSAGLFWLGVGLSAWHAPAALALALICGRLWARGQGGPKSAAGFWAGAGTFALLLILCHLLAGLIYDFSYDGQCYHQDGIMALAEGWNPVQNPFPAKFTYMLKHYPKGSWIWAGAIYKLTGGIEPGKMFNLLFLAVGFLAAFNFLGRVRLGSAGLRIWLALLGAVGPTVVTELYSYYLDGMLVNLLLIVLLLSLDFYLYGQKRHLWLLFLAGIVLFNLKFTALIYGLAFMFFLALALWRKDRARGLIYGKCVLAAFVLGGLMVGYNPYVTNTVYYYSPFYPMPKENVARFQAPPDFMQKDRFRKLFYSLFSTSSANMRKMPRLKIPFTVKSSEIASLGTTSLRYGGLGPLSSGVLVLLPMGALLVFRRSPRLFWAGAGLTGLVLLTVLAIPEPWYTRFVPQLWLIPMSWLALLFLAQGRAARVLAGVILALLTLNQALFLGANLAHWQRTQKAFDQQIAELKEASRTGRVTVQGNWRSQRLRLESLGLDFQWVSALGCPKPEYLIGSDGTTRICVLPGGVK